MSIGTIDIHTYNQYFNIGIQSDNLNDYGLEDLSNDHNESEPVYTEAFPALPVDEGKTFPDTTAPWNTTRNNMSVRSSIVTQVFTVPSEDRQIKNLSKEKIFQSIMEKTGVVIETNQSKDSSLSIVLTGRQENVAKARKLLLPQLEVQVEVSIQIPKEYHRYLLGSKGKRIAQIENDTSTKINLPRMGSKSDTITIVGNKYSVEKAKEELDAIYVEQAKLASLQLDIPKCYHIFICGAYNENLKNICERNGVRVIVPPYRSPSEQIFISGEKQAVLMAEAEIMAIYQEKHNTCQEVSAPVKKSQHKYIIGPKGNTINEIFAETGVSVIVPPQSSDSETVLLRGNADMLGAALTSVYVKANSMLLDEIDVPNWLHRHIIGPNGTEIKKIMENHSKVHIEFAIDKVMVEGPTNEVLEVKEAILARAVEMRSQMTFFELQIEPKCYPGLKRAIGAINRMRTSNDVILRLPDLNKDSSGWLRIEGSPEAVSTTKQQIVELISKLENEETLELKINNSLIRLMIGSNGRKIKEMNARFPDVSITFPFNNKTDNNLLSNVKNNNTPIPKNKKSNDLLPINNANTEDDKANPTLPIGKNRDKKTKETSETKMHVDDKDEAVVVIRGPQLHADQCYKYLQLHAQDLADKHHRAEIKVPKEFHRLIIGKNGTAIKKLCEDTMAKIGLPPGDSNSDIIVISGDKASVEKARQSIETIVKHLPTIVEIEVDVPKNTGSLNFNRITKSVVDSLTDDKSKPDIQIRMTNDNKAFIKGPKDQVDKAKSTLLNALNEKSFTTQVEAPVAIRGLLIGRNGSALNKLILEHNVEILFAGKGVENQIVNIIGAEKDVLIVKDKLEARIESLTSTIETEISIEPKYQKQLLAYNRNQINKICEDCGDVNVTFPRSSSGSTMVVVKGKKSCVEEAIEKINEAIHKMEISVTVKFAVARKYHKILMGARGKTINQLTHDYEVNIRMPEKINIPANNLENFKPKSKKLNLNKNTKEKQNNIDAVTSNKSNSLKNDDIEDDASKDISNKKSLSTNVLTNGELTREVEFDNHVATNHSQVSDNIVINGDCLLDSKFTKTENIVDFYNDGGDSKLIINNNHDHQEESNDDEGIEDSKNDNEDDDRVGPNHENEEDDDEDEKLSADDVILITGEAENCERAMKAMLALVPKKKKVPTATLR